MLGCVDKNSSVISIHSLSPQRGKFQTSHQDRDFMGVGGLFCFFFFFPSGKCCLKFGMANQTFTQSVSKLIMCFEIISDCALIAAYMLCAQPVQNQLTSKKNTLIPLTMLWSSNVINSYWLGLSLRPNFNCTMFSVSPL